MSSTTPRRRSPKDGAGPDAAASERGDAPPEDAEASPDLTPIVGDNLKQLRADRRLSLDQLAKASGVSRAMLNQIELGRSTPTINVVWKIARALGLPFSALLQRPGASATTVLPAARAWVLRSQDGAFSSRALFPMDQPRHVEFYELRLAAGAVEEAEPHAPGTTENLVVNQGKLRLTVGEESHELGSGDAIVFHADVAHAYANAGTDEAVMYLVMTYARR